MDDLKNVIKTKINSFIYAMEADIKGIKSYWKKGMEDLWKDMEGLKEGGTKLLQERPPIGEKVVEETHDENKINVNHDFIESNVGLKTQHIPKIDMSMLDGKDQETSKEEDIHQEPTPKKEEMNLTISCNALAGITTQSIKIE